MGRRRGEQMLGLGATARGIDIVLPSTEVPVVDNLSDRRWSRQRLGLELGNYGINISIVHDN